MHTKRISLFISLLIFCGAQLSIAQNVDKLNDKYEKAFEKGGFDKALKYNRSLRTKSYKEFGQQNPYLPLTFLNEATISFYTGDFTSFTQNVANALKLAQGIKTIDHKAHLETVIKSISLYLDYGQFAKADSLLFMLEKKSFDELEKPELKHLWLFSQLKIYKGQSKFREGILLADSIVPWYRRQIAEAKNKRDREPWMEYMADFSNELGWLFLDQGDIQSADSVAKTIGAFIDDEFKKKSIQTIENHYLLGKINDARHQDKEAEKLLEDAYGLARSLKNDWDPLVNKIQLTLIDTYLHHDRRGKYNSEIKTYKERIKSQYSKKSAFRLLPGIIDLRATYLKGDHQLFEQKAANWLQNAQQYPQDLAFLPDVWLMISNNYEAMNRYTDAAGYFSRYLHAVERNYGSNSVTYHLAKLKRAGSLIEYTNKLEEAGDIYRESWYDIASKEIEIAHHDFVPIHNSLSDYFWLISQIEKSKEAIGTALDATLKTYQRDQIPYALQLQKVANQQILLGDYNKAGQYLNLIEPIFRKDRNDLNAINYGKWLHSRSQLLIKRGLYNEAENELFQSLKYIDKADLKIQNDWTTIEALAETFRLTGQYEDAEELIDQLIYDYQKSLGPDNKNLIDVWLMKANILLQKGDYTKSEKIITKASELCRNVYGQKSIHEVPILTLEADVSSNIGDFESAEKQINAAIDQYTKELGQFNVYLAEIYQKQAIIGINLSRSPDTVHATLEKAREIITEELDEQSPLYAFYLQNKALAFIYEQKFTKAFPLLKQAEQIWLEKVNKKNNINVASVYMLLGDMYYMLQNYNEAEINYDLARRIYNKLFSKEHPDYVKSLARLSRVAYMKKDYKNALSLIEDALESYDQYIRYFFSSLSETEKARFWNSIKDDYEYYNTLVVTISDDSNDKMIGRMYNNALRTKALLLNNSVKMRESIMSSPDPAIRQTFQDWLAAKELQTKTLSMNLEELMALNIDTDSLYNAINRMEKDLSMHSALFNNQSQNAQLEWEDVQKALKPGEVALEMARFRLFDQVFSDSIYYAVLMLKSDSEQKRPELILLKNGEDLEDKYFKYYKNSIIYRYHDEYSYQNFWAKIEIRIGNPTTIYLSPDGVYNQINLEVIPVNDSLYVLDRSNIVLLSNTKDLAMARKKEETKDKTAILFGDPDYYLEVNPDHSPIYINKLPGTRKEVTRLSEILESKGWHTEQFLSDEATEEVVKNKKNAAVFHIATHGFYSPSIVEDENLALEQLKQSTAVNNPLMRSGLMLNGAGDILAQTQYKFNMMDGILTAYEAMNLNLDYTDLVVLSACETGVGDVTAGEGVYGLQRAFIVAGADNLIMSLFKVSDQATSELMVNFYDYWLKTGNLRSSFVQAKKTIREKYSDPIDWGAFILIGMD
jgi:CHAT domain-containing protein